MIGRRAFLQGAAVAAIAAPRIGNARPVRRPALPRIGVIGEISPIPWTVRTSAADIECRWSGDHRETLPALAAELVARHVDVIVAIGAASTRAARDATRSTPIVFVASGDPAEQGLVTSMERPGAHATGLVTPSDADAALERLSVLKRVVPDIRRIAVLVDPDGGPGKHMAVELCAMAPRHGLEALTLAARDQDEIDQAFSSMRSAAATGVLVLPDALFAIHRRRIVELAAAHRLPAVYGARSFVDAGGLMALSGDSAEMIRRTTAIVARVLAGADPATLPVERYTRTELTVNLSAARVLGVSIPNALLAQANGVIES